MKLLDELRAGVVGTGFIGAVHVDALRRLGVEVLGIAGSTSERARAKSLAPAYESSTRCSRTSASMLFTSTVATCRTGSPSRRTWNWRLETDKGGELRAVGDNRLPLDGSPRFVTGP